MFGGLHSPLAARGASLLRSHLVRNPPRQRHFLSPAGSVVRPLAAMASPTVFKDVPQAPPDPILVRRVELSS